MKRTTTTRSRFIISTTNWLVKWLAPRPQTGLFLVILIALLSCKDDTGIIGIKNPNRDFELFTKEFVIPTSVFAIDSVSTSNSASGTETHRIMLGKMTDPRFGTTTASSFLQYYSVGVPDTIDDKITFEKVTLTMISDFYWQGNETPSNQVYRVYEVTDSILNYLPHFSYSSEPYGPLLGEAVKFVNPGDLDQSVIDNGDSDLTNNVVDSLVVDLDPNFGRRLLAAATDTLGSNENNYQFFYKFRRIFKGLAIIPVDADKIVGFNPNDKLFRITLQYKHGSITKRLFYYFSPPGLANPGAGEYLTYTNITPDRSGTPLAGLTSKYTEFNPSDNNRYIQAGTGLLTKLDFSEVYSFFENIPVKSFSVAELRIEADEQKYAPTKFLLRALKPNLRNLQAIKTDTDAAGDPETILDTDLASKHAIDQGSLTRMQPVGDDGLLFTLNQISNSGSSVYKGYLTTFLQRETSITDGGYLRSFALVPHTPENGKSVNGFYFSPDKVILKIFYTIPTAKN